MALVPFPSTLSIPISSKEKIIPAFPPSTHPAFLKWPSTGIIELYWIESQEASRFTEGCSTVLWVSLGKHRPSMEATCKGIWSPAPSSLPPTQRAALLRKLRALMDFWPQQQVPVLLHAASGYSLGITAAENLRLASFYQHEREIHSRGWALEKRESGIFLTSPWTPGIRVTEVSVTPSSGSLSIEDCGATIFL